MVNPVVAWFEFFLVLYNNLPFPIIALFSLSIGFVFVSSVFHIVFTIRS